MSVLRVDMNEEHDLLVRGLGKALVEQKSMEIRGMALKGYPRRPWPINGYTPDIIAFEPGRELMVIGEALTQEDMDSRDTEEELFTFSELIMAGGASKGSKVPLHIAVSPDCEEEVQILLDDLDILDIATVWVYGQLLAM